MFIGMGELGAGGAIDSASILAKKIDDEGEKTIYYLTEAGFYTGLD